MAAQHKTGLSLSGGGYRATAFHLGTLRKLHSMGVLQKINVISTISGGSITGAFYVLHAQNFDEFYSRLYGHLQSKNVIRGVLLSWTFLKLLLFAAVFLVPATYLLLTSYAWVSPLFVLAFVFFLARFQFVIFPVSRRIEKLYENFFFAGARLSELPNKPELVIGSTNLQTSRAFTFSKYWMGDSTYQYMQPPVGFKPSEFPVARAVMASTCVPFAFTPVTIAPTFFNDPANAQKIHPALVDGGVYDNQGIHKMVQQGSYACDNVITSDAGGGASGELTFRNTFALLLQTVEVFMSRIKKVQMVKDVYANADAHRREIAYLSLAWDTEKCIPGFIDNMEAEQIPLSVMVAHGLLPEWIAKPTQFQEEITARLEAATGYPHIDKPSSEERELARRVSTNLTPLSKRQLDALIRQAESLTEIQVKLYCPSLIG